MKPTITTILLISIVFSSYSQSSRWSVTGNIQDEKGQGLPSATITLLDPADSTLVTFGVTNPSGGFEVKNLREEALLLQVSFVGFETFHKKITKPIEGNSSSLGTIILKEATADLDVFTIEAIAPVTIKKDTVEFHADAFKTNPNANVEDLLKRLSGVEVDTDGNIKAQGETVRRILVDGKEFFGTDPKLASRNLLAEAIEK
uniref:carboxypeptidase regulatory-like domain-containing protein n=1 Tax=Aquiflexum sp. TaxID=1872584 RepID=UPI00359352C9